MYTFGQINTNSNEKNHKQIIPVNNNFINENGNYILKVNKKEEHPVNKKININVDKNTNNDKKFNISFDQNTYADKNENTHYPNHDRGSHEKRHH